MVHMAATFRQWSHQGYAEGQSGHISVRDPEFPAIMWMNPLSRHYGTLTAGDMLPIEIETGRIVGGNPNKRTGRRTANLAGYFSKLPVEFIFTPCIHILSVRAKGIA